VCCAFTFCWWANTDLLLEQDAPLAVVLEGEVASTSASMVERGKKRTEGRHHPLCWPQALRKVRTWLEPYVMLWRYWKAYSEKPPPKELRRLLARVFLGKGLYLYVH
jgi:hypothetical protein